MKRKLVKNSNFKKKFAINSAKTKKINYDPPLYRGGIRL